MAAQLAFWSRPAATAMACLLVAACSSAPSSSPSGTSSATPAGASATPALEAAPIFVRKSGTRVLPGDWAVVAAADVNEDGKPDVVATTLASFGLGVLIGHGDGTFDDPADIDVSPTDFVRAADLDGDGHLDLVAAGERLAILRGTGDGTFEAPDYYDAGPHSADVELNLFGIAIADMTGDQSLDLVTTNWGASQLAILPGKGDGTFEAASLFPCVTCIQAAAVDLDRDGDTDVVTTSFIPPGPGSVFVFLNEGKGKLGKAVAYDPKGNAHALALGDLNRDGAVDAITGNDRTFNASVLLGRSDGTFGEARTYPAGNTHSIGVGDVDGDGNLDVMSASIFDTKVWFFRGVGDGSLVETQGVPALPAGGMALADLDGDGKLDLILGEANSDTNTQLIFAYLQ